MARRKPLNLPPSRPEVIAFLREAKENPDDDAPRFILADWLEDRGDPRGEFVRLQVEAARRESEGDDARELFVQAGALYQLHSAEWLGNIASHTRSFFKRGLVGLSADPRRFLGRTWQQQAGSERWEWVECVSLEPVDTDILKRLVNSPLLPSVGNLDLHLRSRASLEYLAHLMHSSAVAGLRSLSLEGEIEPDFFCDLGQILASSQRLAGLRQLYLEVIPFGPEAARDLADSPFLGRLHTLTFVGCDIGDEGLRSLSQSPHLGHIRHLTLECDDFSEEGIKALIASRHLGQLETLSLIGNAFPEATIRLLREAPPLRRLRKLDIY